MHSKDLRDLLSGALLLIGGAVFSLYAFQNYDIGTLRQMGPGLFPAALGLLLALFGVILLVQAWMRPGEPIEIAVWSPLFVLAGIGAFALLVRPFGVVPAIFAVTFISSLADLKFRPVAMAILSGSLSVASWLIFEVGLRLPIQMFRWPF